MQPHLLRATIVPRWHSRRHASSPGPHAGHQPAWTLAPTGRSLRVGTQRSPCGDLHHLPTVRRCRNRHRDTAPGGRPDAGPVRCLTLSTAATAQRDDLLHSCLPGSTPAVPTETQRGPYTPHLVPDSDSSQQPLGSKLAVGRGQGHIEQDRDGIGRQVQRDTLNGCAEWFPSSALPLSTGGFFPLVGCFPNSKYSPVWISRPPWRAQNSTGLSRGPVYPAQFEGDTLSLRIRIRTGLAREPIHPAPVYADRTVQEAEPCPTKPDRKAALHRKR